MEYTYAAIAILATGMALAIGRGPARDPAFWIGLLIFGALTIIGDNVLVAAEVFRYAASSRSGIDIGRIPIEDLLYGMAFYLFSVTGWYWKHST